MYSEIVGTLNTIVSHVQNDRVKMIELQTFAQGVLDSYRRGLEVHYEYTTTGTPSDFLTATSPVNTTASREKRKLSYVEVNRGRGNGAGGRRKRVKTAGRQTNFGETSDQEVVSIAARSRRSTKSCTLCGYNSGHSAFTCQLLKNFGESLKRNNQDVRSQLISDLVNHNRFVVTPLLGDDRIVHTSLPIKVLAMILHSKCQLGSEVVIEATLIRNKAIDEEHRNSLFRLGPIDGWLQTSRSKPVVNFDKN
jgi:hypothetical protein